MTLPRLGCPECGSADVVIGDRTLICNGCGETSRVAAAMPVADEDLGPLPLDEIFRRCA